MKKITILALHDGIGGVEKYIETLCLMLQDNFELEIIFTYKSKNRVYEFPKAKINYLINDISNRKELKDAIKQMKIIKIFKEGKKALKLLYLKRKLNIKTIKKIRSDYIITTRDFHNKYVGKYAQKDIIKIATEHNHHHNNSKYINKTLKCIKKLNYFVLVSKELYNFYKDKTKVTCVFIPNTYDLSIEKKADLNNNKLISVGRLNPEKGYLDLIEVMRILNIHNKNINLSIIGDGEQKETIIAKIKEYNLEKNIHLLGFLNSEEISHHLTESSMFIMTSYTESFGIVLLEAMEAGLLPIAFDSAEGACEILENDKELLISNRDINLMAEKILYYLNNKSKLKEKAKEINKIKEKYNMKEVKKLWLNLLEKR